MGFARKHALPIVRVNSLISRRCQCAKLATIAAGQTWRLSDAFAVLESADRMYEPC